MNLLLMLLGVLIVYLGVVYVYRKNWSKGLLVELSFEKEHVVKGESVNLVEVITNDKRLPLPCVNLKFHVDRELVFNQKDTNSTVTDKSYRNDVFSLLSHQRITRRVPITCTRRGVYGIEGLETTFAGVFMNEINVLRQGTSCHITVFPKAADVSRLSLINSMVSGEVERRKYLLEDPFVFRGIRDYDSHDSMKNVNWKASAKTGGLMVNEFNESMSRNVCILLNVEADGALMNDTVSEEAISIAAGMSQMFIEQGVNVSLISNGCDYETGEQALIKSGSGVSHLNYINGALARMDLDRDMEEYESLVRRAVIENRFVEDSQAIYVIISANCRRNLQETIGEITVSQNQTVWIVPHMPGLEVDLEYCNINPIGWEIY